MRLTLAREVEATARRRQARSPRAAARGTGRVLRVRRGGGALGAWRRGRRAGRWRRQRRRARDADDVQRLRGALRQATRQGRVRRTHNAMSAATNPNWLFAQQDRGIGTQLDDGDPRAADRHALRAGELTRRGDRPSARRRGTERTRHAAVGPEAAQAAERLRDRIKGGGQGTPGIYLCHASASSARSTRPRRSASCAGSSHAIPERSCS